MTVSLIPRPSSEKSLVEIETILQEIGEYLDLEFNWDGEGALPVSEDVIWRTENLLLHAAESARPSGVSWINPVAAPVSDGSISLTWEVENRWLFLRIVAESEDIDCVRQESIFDPVRCTQVTDDAVRSILWVLGNR